MKFLYSNLKLLGVIILTHGNIDTGRLKRRFTCLKQT